MSQAQTMLPAPRDKISIGEWLVTFLISGIPVLGFIALLIWSFDERAQPTKATWAKAMLIWHLISFIITIFILTIVMGLRLG